MEEVRQRVSRGEIRLKGHQVVIDLVYSRNVLEDEMIRPHVTPPPFPHTHYKRDKQNLQGQ